MPESQPKTGEPVSDMPRLLQKLRAGGVIEIVQRPWSGQFESCRITTADSVHSVRPDLYLSLVYRGRLDVVVDSINGAGQRVASYSLRASSPRRARSRPAP